MKKLKIYTDGGARGNPGPAAIGIVVQDEKGQILFQQGKAIGWATNNQAEYQALIRALTWTKNQPIQPETIDCYLDSQLVVAQMQGRYRIKSDSIKKLWQQAKQLEQTLSPTKINYHLIPRRLNQKADQLLNQALDLLK